MQQTLYTLLTYVCTPSQTFAPLVVILVAAAVALASRTFLILSTAFLASTSQLKVFLTLSLAITALVHASHFLISANLTSEPSPNKPSFPNKKILTTNGATRISARPNFCPITNVVSSGRRGLMNLLMASTRGAPRFGSPLMTAA